LEDGVRKTSNLHILLLAALRLMNDINNHYAQMLPCLYTSSLNSSKYSKGVFIVSAHGIVSICKVLVLNYPNSTQKLHARENLREILSVCLFVVHDFKGVKRVYI
jgi:hypothetical protein